MVREHNAFVRLTVEQRRTLVEVARKRLGTSTAAPQFAAYMLDLFDDIAGFETISKRTRKRLLNELWELYRHGQSEPQKGEAKRGHDTAAPRN